MIIDCILDEEEKKYVEEHAIEYHEKGAYIRKVFRCVTGEIGLAIRYLKNAQSHLCQRENYTCMRNAGDRQFILDAKSNMPIFVNFCPFCGVEA